MIFSKQSNHIIHRKLTALFLLSAALIAYQIQLMQFLRIVQWHHFASGIISIALLGFGASGTMITIFRKRMMKHSSLLIPFFMISSGLLMSLCFFLSTTEFAAFDSYTLFVEQKQIIKFIFSCILYFLPFFIGASAIGLLFVIEVSKIGSYYFSNMLGSGFGGILIFVLLWSFLPQKIPQIISLLPVFAGLLLLSKKTIKFLIPVALVSVTVTMIFIFHTSEIKFSQYKSISYAMNLPDANPEYIENSPYGYIQTVSSPVQRYAPGLSLNYFEDIPICDVIFKDGNWFTTVQKSGREQISNFYSHTTAALPYSLFSPKKVLILGTGGGLELPHALHNGVQEIHLIEPNRKVTYLLQNEFALINDSIYRDPRISIINEEYRTYVSSTDETYDLIILPYLGEFGGSVGLEALNENNIMTIEAFRELMARLNPSGMITLSVWNDLPPKLSLRSLHLIAESIHPEKAGQLYQSILSVRSWGTLTYVFKTEAFDEHQIEQMKEFCVENSFDPFLYPGIMAKERSALNEIENSQIFAFTDSILNENAKNMILEYPYNIAAPTDNKPYFHQFLKNEKLSLLFRKKDQSSFQELGYFVLVVSFLIISILALIFILLPLFSIHKKKKVSSWVLLWFAGIGFAYMFVEIVLIKQFILFLGQSVFSASAVISVMLVSSGFGSLYTSKIVLKRNNLVKITGLIVLVLISYSLLLNPLLKIGLSLPFYIKILLSFFIIAIPGFIMGMPFPMGLKMTNSMEKTHIPWAWGINGCVSVISAGLAAILAIELGYNSVLLFGAVGYFIAMLSLFLFQRE